MALKFSLEYSSATQDAVYIDLRDNPSIFQDRISKEKYDSLPIAEKDDFLTDIFNISGVVEFATQAYMMWLMKSIQFDWEEVLETVLFITSVDLGESGALEELEGSASIEGPEDPERPCTVPTDATSRRSLSQGVTIVGSSISMAMSAPAAFATKKPRPYG